MTEPIENGMVVGAEREWNRMYGETPYDRADMVEMEEYASDQGRLHEVVTHVCGLEPEDMDEEIAVMVMAHLNKDELEIAFREWFLHVNIRKYNAWYNERHDWDD